MKIKTNISALASALIIAFLVTWSSSVFSAERYWVNNSGSWTDRNHWSEVSGGIPGASVPGPGDNVYFDDLSCSEDITVILPEKALCYDFIFSASREIVFRGKSKLSVYNRFSVNKYFHFKGAGFEFLSENGPNGVLSDDPDRSVNSLVFTAYYSNSCGSGSGGFISFGITDGVEPFLFAWTSDPSGVWDDSKSYRNNCPQGYYEMWIGEEDGAGPWTMAFETLTENLGASPIIGTITGTDESSLGACDGIADLTVTGGSGSYTFEWSDGQASEDISSLCASQYWVYTFDANHCADMDTVVIGTQSDPCTGFAASISASNNPLCNGAANGSATAFASGGATPYVYSWSNSGNTSTLNNLSAGSYTVTVSDASSCSDVASVILTDPPLLTLSGGTITNTTCVGCCDGSASVVAGGGTGSYSYSWPGGLTGTSQTGLCSGSYVVTVSDANLCTSTYTLTITDPDIISASISDFSNPSCFGDSDGWATVAALGGVSPYSYLWSNGQDVETATGLGSGTYTVTVTDNTSAFVEVEVVLTDPASLVVSITGADTSCSTQELLTSTSGFASYQWYLNGSILNGETSETLNTDSAGNYSVIVSDGSCYGESAAHELEFISFLPFSIDGITSFCQGDSIYLSVADTLNAYRWYLDGLLIDGADSSDLYVFDEGVYNVEVGYYQCLFASEDHVVFQNLPAVIVTNPQDATVCAGADTSFAVAASGDNLNYQWLFNGTVLTGQVSPELIIINGAAPNQGQYSCVVWNECAVDTSSEAEFSLQQVNIISQPSDTAICQGSTVVLSVETDGGGYSYQWKKDGQGIFGAESSSLSLSMSGPFYEGVYSCQIVGNCSSGETEGAILSLNNIEVLSQPMDGFPCTGDSVVYLIEAEGTGLAYQWYYNSIALIDDTLDVLIIDSADISKTGYYSCVVTNQCGSVASEEAELFIDSVWIISQPEDLIGCEGTSNTISLLAGSPSGEVTYVWDKDGIVISDDQSFVTFSQINSADIGTYSCLVSGLCNSVQSVPAGLSMATLDVLSVPVDVVKCSGDSVRFAVLAQGDGVLYQWIHNSYYLMGETGSELLITELNAGDIGNYRCSVANQCESLYTEPAFLDIEFLEIETSSTVDVDNQCIGSALVSIVEGSGPFSYLWSNALSSATAQISSLCAGTYEVTVTNSMGCLATESVEVQNTVGVEEIMNDTFSMFPVPSPDGILYLKSGHAKEIVEIRIFDSLGKETEKTIELVADDLMKISLKNFTSGFYIASIISNSENISVKFSVR